MDSCSQVWNRNSVPSIIVYFLCADVTNELPLFRNNNIDASANQNALMVIKGKFIDVTDHFFYYPVAHVHLYIIGSTYFISITVYWISPGLWNAVLGSSEWRLKFGTEHGQHGLLTSIPQCIIFEFPGPLMQQYHINEPYQILTLQNLHCVRGWNK